MDVDALRAIAGAGRFELACTWAWKTAKDTGTGWPAEWPDDLQDVPHEIDAYWTDHRLATAERLALAQTVYRLMPAYWNAVGQRHIRDDGGPTDRASYWTEVRSLLDQPDDRLANPISYDLWADTFEVQASVPEAWTELVITAPTQRRLERVIEISGPIPYETKRPLLYQLARDEAQHERVAQALTAGATELYGAIDLTDATDLVLGLNGVEHIATRRSLKAALRRRGDRQVRAAGRF